MVRKEHDLFGRQIAGGDKIKVRGEDATHSSKNIYRKDYITTLIILPFT